MAYSSAWLAGENFHALLGHIVSLRLDYRRMCANAGIDHTQLVDRSIPVPFGACLKLFEEAAVAARDPWFGLHFGEVEALTPTLTYYIQTNSPTLEHALRETDRLLKLCTNALEHSFYRTKQFGACRYVIPAEHLPCDQFIDFMAARKVNLIRSVLGSSWQPVKVLLQRRRPADLSELERVLGSKLAFGRAVTEVQVGLKDLATAPRDADPLLLEATRRASGRILIATQVDHEKFCLIRSLIVDHLAEPNLTLKRVAGWAGMRQGEVRSVLAEAGLKFKSLLDSQRQERARKLLSETEIDLTEIAFLLGFSELSAFSRAARKWFGQSPSQFRAATSQLRSRRPKAKAKPQAAKRIVRAAQLSSTAKPKRKP